MKKIIGLVCLIIACLFLFIYLKKVLRPSNYEIKKPTDDTSFNPTPLQTKPRETTFALAGEMIFARTVALKINQAKDYRLPFYQIKPILDQADFRLATLEAPLLGKNTPCGVDCMVFQADEENIYGLKFADINLVSLAANHIMDAGIDGLKKTIELLDQNEISHVGAGLNEDLAKEPVVKEINGLKIGFLAYNNIPPQNYSAGIDQAGSNWLSQENLVRDIKQLRPQVDLLFIICHWGIEYTAQPNEDQIKLAHIAIDNGADLIIGDHPHWIQAIEFYQDKLIFYGLGNFVFDQLWSLQTEQGMLVLITYQGKKLRSLSIIPFLIDDYVQPRPLAGQEKEQMIDYILSLSDKESRKKLNQYLKD